MNRRHKNRLIMILCALIALGGAASLVLYALRQNINLFYTPTALLHATLIPRQIIRIGGYVQTHSVHFSSNGETVRFRVTDHSNSIPVLFHGVLPTLFREGQGIVITGQFNHSHQFIADQVLAKHDEKYMPAIVKKMLNHAA